MNKQKVSCQEELKFPFCEDVRKYEQLAKIGQGTFGEVFKAREKSTGKVVALKKILMENEKEGFPITALREIKILKLLTNPNVVKLIEICHKEGGTQAANLHRTQKSNSNLPNISTFYLVFEFCEHDMAGLLSNPAVKFNLGEIKKVIQQLLNGLHYIHINKILHRDLKASNVLITKSGILKLADFGLARAMLNKANEKNKYTNRVVTLWYRPPELLLGERMYGPAVDMWGAGCIMAEMWTRTPILQGSTEQHQLDLIAKLCGTISTETWPGVKDLELFHKFNLPKVPKRVYEKLRPYLKDPLALDLLDKLLTLDPSKRIESSAALDHDFFWSDPMPSDLSRMLSAHNQSMFEYLTPTRRPGGVKASLAQQKPQDTISSYQERVY